MGSRWMIAVSISVATGACGSGQQPAREPSAAAVVPAAAPSDRPALAEASATREEAAPARPVVPSIGEPITGIQQCDEYLDLYKRCEKRMEAEIAAGNAIRYQNEAARLKYLQSTPEAPGLPQACTGWLERLRGKCP
ncbi:MAG: hypothetical protein HY898_30765 [Deltaproteobacteria bacterium]|nr:hypothetical protein [Deltaproteobacteria bacterium]